MCKMHVSVCLSVSLSVSVFVCSARPNRCAKFGAIITKHREERSVVYLLLRDPEGRADPPPGGGRRAPRTHGCRAGSVMMSDHSHQHRPTCYYYRVWRERKRRARRERSTGLPNTLRGWGQYGCTMLRFSVLSFNVCRKLSHCGRERWSCETWSFPVEA